MSSIPNGRAKPSDFFCLEWGDSLRTFKSVNLHFPQNLALIKIINTLLTKINLSNLFPPFDEI